MIGIVYQDENTLLSAGLFSTEKVASRTRQPREAESDGR